MDGMTLDNCIARASFKTALGWVDQLREIPLPIPYGKTQYFQSLVPKRDPDDMLKETNPYWLAYAETIREFKSMLETLPKQEFVSKKKA